jgi:transposase
MCPICGSENVKASDFGDGYMECKDCGADWNPNKNKKKRFRFWFRIGF